MSTWHHRGHHRTACIAPPAGGFLSEPTPGGPPNSAHRLRGGRCLYDRAHISPRPRGAGIRVRRAARHGGSPCGTFSAGCLRPVSDTARLVVFGDWRGAVAAGTSWWCLAPRRMVQRRLPWAGCGWRRWQERAEERGSAGQARRSRGLSGAPHRRYPEMTFADENPTDAPTAVARRRARAPDGCI